MTLDDLLVSGEELDESLLRDALVPFIRIDQETLQIRPQAAFRALKANGRIVVYLLSRKGLRAMDRIEDERVSPAEIIGAIGSPSGSVYPALKGLYERRPQVVDKTADSRYWIPNWAIGDATAVIGVGLPDA